MLLGGRSIIMLRALLLVAAASALAASGPDLGDRSPDRKDPRAPHHAPLVIEVDATHLDLQPVSEGLYRSQPFRIMAGSILPRWRISVLPDRPTGPASLAKVAPPRVLLVPSRDLGNPGKAYGGAALALDGATVVAVGGPTGGRIHEINSFSLMVESDPLSAPGLYRGSMRIIPEVPGGGAPRQQFQMDYEWNVVELLAVDVKGHVLDFGTTGPGISESRNVVSFEVFSNHQEAEILVEMQPLARDGDGELLPPSVTCIGYGSDPIAARQDAASAPFGRNEIRIVVGPGRHLYAISGRVQLSPLEPAGTYNGLIVITSRVIR